MSEKHGRPVCHIEIWRWAFAMETGGNNDTFWRPNLCPDRVRWKAFPLDENEKWFLGHTKQVWTLWTESNIGCPTGH
jgi:hypothetical protein